LASPACADVLVVLAVDLRCKFSRREKEVGSYSAWPSMTGPNSSHFAPEKRIICTCSIG